MTQDGIIWFNIITLFAYAEIWLMLMLMLKNVVRKYYSMAEK
jgi:hypothetical protein